MMLISAALFGAIQFETTLGIVYVQDIGDDGPEVVVLIDVELWSSEANSKCDTIC